MTSDPTQPEAAEAETTDAGTTDAEAAEAAEVPETQLTRRERRARAGGPTDKVLGPVQGKRHAAPAKGRDYAHRRKG